MDISARTYKFIREKHNQMILSGNFNPELFWKDFSPFFQERERKYKAFTSEHVPIDDISAPKSEINKNINNKIHFSFYNLIVDQGVQLLNGNPTTYLYDMSEEREQEVEKYRKDLEKIHMAENPDIPVIEISDEPEGFTNFKRLMNKLKAPTVDVEISEYQGATGCGFRYFTTIDEGRTLKSQVVESWFAERLEDAGVVVLPKFTDDGTLFYELHLITENEITVYKSTNSGITDGTIGLMELGLTGFIKEGETVENPLGVITLVEFKNNPQRYCDFEQVESVIEAIDKLVSAQQNEIDMFRLAYLLITGMKVGKKSAEDILKSAGIINLPEANGKAQYLTKQVNVDFNRMQYEELLTAVFTFSDSVNFGGKAFQGDTSGSAREWQIKPLEDRVKLKEKFFREGLREVATIVNAYFEANEQPTMELERLDFDFKRSVPSDIGYLADAISKLKGIVSDTTLASEVPFVDDAHYEREMKNYETNERLGMSMMSNMIETKSLDVESKSSDVEEPKIKEENVEE